MFFIYKLINKVILKENSFNIYLIDIKIKKNNKSIKYSKSYELY